MFQTVTDSRRRANTGHAVHPNGSPSTGPPKAQVSTVTASRGTFPSALVYWWTQEPPEAVWGADQEHKASAGLFHCNQASVFFSVLPNAALWTLMATFHCCSQISATTTCSDFTLMIIAFLLWCNRSSIHHIHFLSHPLQFHHLTARYQFYMPRVAPTALKYAGVCPALDIFQPCWISND